MCVARVTGADPYLCVSVRAFDTTAGASKHRRSHGDIDPGTGLRYTEASKEREAASSANPAKKRTKV